MQGARCLTGGRKKSKNKPKPLELSGSLLREGSVGGAAGGTVNRLILTGFCHPGPQRCCCFSLSGPRLTEASLVTLVTQGQAETDHSAEDGRSAGE